MRAKAEKVALFIDEAIALGKELRNAEKESQDKGIKHSELPQFEGLYKRCLLSDERAVKIWATEKETTGKMENASKVIEAIKAYSERYKDCVSTEEPIKPLKNHHTHQKQVLTALGQEHPILSKYQSLCEQRAKVRGYRGEQLDKSLKVVARAITENRDLMVALGRELPKIAFKIQERLLFRNDLGREI